MKPRVLLTGATGFVGSHLVDSLLKNNFEVIAAVRHSSNTDSLQNKDITIAKVDFHDIALLQNLIETSKPQYVLHNAGLTKTLKKEDYYKANVDILSNIVNAIALANFKPLKLLFVSSLAAFGPLPFDSDLKINNTTVPKPITTYGKSKLAAEAILKNQNQLDFIIVRPTAVYGPGEKDIFQMFELVSKNFEINFGTKEQKLTLIYVKDLVDVIIALMLSNIKNKSYFVTDGKHYSGATFLGQIKSTLNKKTIKIKLPLLLLQTMAYFSEKYSNLTGNPAALNKEKVAELVAENWICDIEDLQKDINFKPKYNLKQGVEETTEWYKVNKWLK
jgi:nucleoside-diphosphate-sugar epimerase